jgi:hypothetical protein
MMIDIVLARTCISDLGMSSMTLKGPQIDLRCRHPDERRSQTQ